MRTGKERERNNERDNRSKREGAASANAIESLCMLCMCVHHYFTYIRVSRVVIDIIIIYIVGCAIRIIGSYILYIFFRQIAPFMIGANLTKKGVRYCRGAL